jgi:hypothetical protein
MIKNLFVLITAVLVSALSAMFAVGNLNAAPSGVWPSNGFQYERSIKNGVLNAITQAENLESITISDNLAQSARKAFILEPTADFAAATIGLSIPADKIDQKRAIMRNAAKMTKRNSVVSGWLMGDSGARGDVTELLELYDTTLRIGGPRSGYLASLLASSLENPSFVEPIREMLLSDPPWAGRFWAKLVDHEKSLSNGLPLRISLIDQELDNVVYSDLGYIQALVDAEYFEEADRLYSALVSETPDHKNLIRNPSFDTLSRYPPLDWELRARGTYGAVIDRSTGQLQMSAVNRTSAILARQLVRFSSLKAKLSVDMARNDNAVLAGSIKCAESGGSDAPINFTIDQKKQATDLDRPRNDCQYYWLELRLRMQSVDPSEIDINKISLFSL